MTGRATPVGLRRRVSRQKLLKGCYQGQIFTVLAIQERLELKFVKNLPTIVADNIFPVFHGPSTLKSISTVLNKQKINIQNR